jgi:hypothetical protein
MLMVSEELQEALANLIAGHDDSFCHLLLGRGLSDAGAQYLQYRVGMFQRTADLQSCEAPSVAALFQQQTDEPELLF